MAGQPSDQVAEAQLARVRLPAGWPSQIQGPLAGPKQQNYRYSVQDEKKVCYKTYNGRIWR